MLLGHRCFFITDQLNLTFSPETRKSETESIPSPNLENFYNTSPRTHRKNILKSRNFLHTRTWSSDDGVNCDSGTTTSPHHKSSNKRPKSFRKSSLEYQIEKTTQYDAPDSGRSGRTPQFNVLDCARSSVRVKSFREKEKSKQSKTYRTKNHMGSSNFDISSTATLTSTEVSDSDIEDFHKKLNIKRMIKSDNKHVSFPYRISNFIMCNSG